MDYLARRSAIHSARSAKACSSATSTSPRPVRRQEDSVGGNLRRLLRHHPRQARDELARLGRRPSTSKGRISRRGSASFPAASATACICRKCSRAAPTCCCSTSRPTTTTSTRFARGSAARLRRLRRHHQPRPVLPRPRRHPHAGLRRQFRRLREGQEAPPRDRQRHPAPAEVQEVQPLAWVT